MVTATMSRAGLGFRGRLAWPLGVDAVWLASPVFVVALAALFSPVRPFDYFWALVQGRALVQLGRIPSENLFLHTLPAHAPFFDQPWLSQLAMFGAYSSGGHGANVIVLALCLGLSFGLLIDAALRLGADARAVSLIALFSVPLVVLGAGVRTQMFAYPCFAFLLRQAALGEVGRNARNLALSALVAAAWANVHGSFVLAPLLMAAPAAVALLERLRQRGSSGDVARHARACVAVTLGTFLNPSGPWVYVYAAQLGRSMRVGGKTDVSEWQALSFGAAPGVLFAALSLASIALLVVFRRNFQPALVLVCLAFDLLSLSSQRFVCWWALSAIIALGPLFQAPEAASVRGIPVANSLLIALFGGTLLLTLPGMPLFEWVARGRQVPYPEASVLGVETPLRIGEALARSGYRGKLFHNQAVGGFLEWVLAREAPKAVAFVDQRFELIPAEIWRDYFAISQARGDFRELLERYGIGTALIHEQQDAPLVKALSLDSQWRLAARELGYCLFTRQRSENASPEGAREH